MIDSSMIAALNSVRSFATSTLEIDDLDAYVSPYDDVSTFAALTDDDIEARFEAALLS